MCRFGEDGSPLYHEEIATAVLNSVVVLDLLDRPEEALEACEEALRRFGSGDEPYGAEAVAQALVSKGVLLSRSGPGRGGIRGVGRGCPALRGERRVGSSRRGGIGAVQSGRTRIDRRPGKDRRRILNRALPQARGGIPYSRLHGHLIRARAHLAEGDGEACAGDVETALSILPELNMLPREVLVALADLSAGVGPERMCDLIKFSPASELLLPLRTALERELGLEPRVAREVEEIAEDIRRNCLRGLRAKLSAGQLDRLGLSPSCRGAYRGGLWRVHAGLTWPAVQPHLQAGSIRTCSRRYFKAGARRVRHKPLDVFVRAFGDALGGTESAGNGDVVAMKVGGCPERTIAPRPVFSGLGRRHVQDYA